MCGRAEYLNKLIQVLKEQDSVFICGPSYGKTHLRIYACGGRLLKIPTGATARITSFDIEYLKYAKDSPALLSAALSVLKTVDGRICTPVFTQKPSERPGSKRMIPVLTLLDADGRPLKGSKSGECKLCSVPMEKEAAFCAAVAENLPALLAMMQNRFVVNGSDDEKERALQTVIARSHRSFAAHSGTVVCDFESSIPQKHLCPGSTGNGSARFDLAALRMRDGGKKAELTVIEYKCNRSACENDSGLKKHAQDMLALEHADAKKNYVSEILRRFDTMCRAPYGLVEAQPDSLLSLLAQLKDHPEDVDLRYAFLFTKGPGLDGSTVKSICEAELGDDRGSFLYQYRDKPEDVDLSVFKPWDQF